jgi:hypothetical protein
MADLARWRAPAPKPGRHVYRYEPSGGHLFVLALIHADPPGDHALAHQGLFAAVELVHRHTGFSRVLRQTQLQFLGPLQVF